MSDLLAQLQATLLGFLEANQYYALALLIGIEEAGVPLPLPGDLAILFMGSQIALGSANPIAVVLVAASSATAGASVLYWLARRLGLGLLRRYGRFVRIDEGSIERFEDWFQRHGGLAIIVGRMIPGLRIAVAVFAGLAQLPYLKFAIYTGISSLLWASFFTGLGWYFGTRWDEVSAFIEQVTGNPLLTALAGLAIGVALTRLYYRRRQRRSESARTNIDRKIAELPAPAEELDIRVTEPTVAGRVGEPEHGNGANWRSRPDSNRRSPP